MPIAAYLDWNATAPLRPAAAQAMSAAMAILGNPSSVHAAGRAAKATLDAARDEVARLVGGDSSGVVFVSGGTEANNAVLRASGATAVLASAIEHTSVLDARDDIEILPVREDGMLDLGALRARLARGAERALVSVMLANNETGAIQPVAEIASLAHAAGARVHCDAVQAAGKIPVDMRALGVDYLTLSAHKLGGPAGIGAVVVAPGAPLDAWLRGGGQERGRRAGTENLIAAAGFGAAVREAVAGLGEMARVAEIRDRIERELLAAAPDALVFGAAGPRLPGTLCISMPGVAAQTQVMAFDLAGVAVSAGAACSSGKIKASHVLAAMGVDPQIAATAIRVSLGWGSVEADAERLITAWRGLSERLGASSAQSAVLAAAVAA